MKRLLPLLLCLSLLVLGGCGGDSTVDVNTRAYGFSLALDLDHLPDEILEASLQNIDQKSEDGTMTAILSQTLGDAMNLYAAGVITVPEGLPDDAMDHLPQQVTLSGDNGPMTCPNSHMTVCPVEGEETILAFLFSFSFDREVFRGQEVTLDIQNCLGGDFSFTWIPTNEGPIRYADMKDAEGNMAGTFNLNAFALNTTLWDAPFEDDPQMTHSLILLDKNGQEIDYTMISGGGSQSTLHASFSTPMDPSVVKSVQIGPYSAELG